jgi:hypothetical protein
MYACNQCCHGPGVERKTRGKRNKEKGRKKERQRKIKKKIKKGIERRRRTKDSASECFAIV